MYLYTNTKLTTHLRTQGCPALRTGRVGLHVCVHYSYITLIGVHEMHGRMHPNQGYATILLAVNSLSLFGYLTVRSTHPVTSNDRANQNFGC